MNFQPHQKFAEDLARRAGKLLLNKFGHSKITVKKIGNDFATDADLASERLIISAIQKKYPTHAILAEESGLTEQTARQPDSQTVRRESGNPASAGQVPKSKIQNPKWVIDPLDGTKNYQFGLPFWCVSIALVENNKSVVGVVYCPVTGELFSARRGGGATSNGKKIHVSSTQKIENALVVVEIPRRHTSGKRFSKDTRAFTEILHHVQRVRAFAAAAYEICLVAKGAADAYLDFSRNTKIWDVAAARLIVTEAGGRVSDTTLPNAEKNVVSILVTNKNLHAEFQKLI